MNELNNKVWLETLKNYCHCVPDEVGNMPCDNGVLCDQCSQPDVIKVYEANLERAENAQHVTYLKMQTMFKDDLQQIVDYMSKNDPNGEYDVADMLCAPMDFIEVLEQWQDDMGCESAKTEWNMINDMISVLYVVYLAKEELK